MPAYVWSCLACGVANPAGEGACASCGCSAQATLAQLERFRTSFLARGGELSPAATHLHEPPELSAAEVLLPLLNLVTLGWLPIYWPAPKQVRQSTPPHVV